MVLKWVKLKTALELQQPHFSGFFALFLVSSVTFIFLPPLVTLLCIMEKRSTEYSMFSWINFLAQSWILCKSAVFLFLTVVFFSYVLSQRPIYMLKGTFSLKCSTEELKKRHKAITWCCVQRIVTSLFLSRSHDGGCQATRLHSFFFFAG